MQMYTVLLAWSASPPLSQHSALLDWTTCSLLSICRGTRLPTLCNVDVVIEWVAGQRWRELHVRPGLEFLHGKIQADFQSVSCRCPAALFASKDAVHRNSFWSAHGAHRNCTTYFSLFRKTDDTSNGQNRPNIYHLFSESWRTLRQGIFLRHAVDKIKLLNKSLETTDSLHNFDGNPAANCILWLRQCPRTTWGYLSIVVAKQAFPPPTHLRHRWQKQDISFGVRYSSSNL